MQVTIFNIKAPIPQVSPAVGELVFVVGGQWDRWVPATCVGWEHFADIDRWFPVFQRHDEPERVACRFVLHERFLHWCFSVDGEPEIPRSVLYRYRNIPLVQVGDLLEKEWYGQGVL
jgi:hypothetical protein